MVDDDPGSARTAQSAPRDSQELALAERHARAKIRRALFGADEKPARVGRYQLLQEMASGGMGVVYSAYDEKLERRVAIKVLHAIVSADARRLIEREARALARLSHPNIVPIHDVLDADGGLAIVMEFVKGQTLGAWVEERPRTWRDVLDVYLQAARGLKAAHELGMVHRDFKPANAIVGHDGRVRVLDFGLVRSRSIADDTTSADSTEQALAMTETIEGVVGTPAYMAPEQVRGVAKAAADQFSFCVALYEALFGQRPFGGTTLTELEHAARSGSVIPPPRNRPAPRWLWAAIRRGLRAEPGERHQSMTALIAALSRDRHRARRWAATLGLAAAAAATAWTIAALGAERSSLPPCNAGSERIATVWNADRRAALRRSFANLNDAYLESATEHVSARLDEYAAEWTIAHRTACLANRRGEEPAIVLTRRSQCLNRHLSALSSAIDVLVDVEPDTAKSVSDVVASLPEIESCSDVNALLAQPLPEDVTTRRRVEALQRDLDRARALSKAGGHDDNVRKGIGRRRAPQDGHRWR